VITFLVDRLKNGSPYEIGKSSVLLCLWRWCDSQQCFIPQELVNGQTGRSPVSNSASIRDCWTSCRHRLSTRGKSQTCT